MKPKLVVILGLAALLSGCSLLKNPYKDYIGVWDLEEEKKACLYFHPDGTVVLEDRKKTMGVLQAEPREDGLLLKVVSGRELERSGVEAGMRTKDGDVFIWMKHREERRELKLLRTTRSLEEDASLKERRAVRRKEDKTPNYMPANFAPLALCLATVDGQVAVGVLKDDRCAIVRIGDECRFYRTERNWRENGVNLYATQEEKAVSYRVLDDGRFIECGVEGEAKGEEIGLPVKMKRIDDLALKASPDPYYGEWTGKMRDREVKLWIKRNGRITLEEKGSYDATYTHSLKYQYRYGMMFAYEDEGPGAEYTDWNKYRLRYDAVKGTLMLAYGSSGKESALVRAEDDRNLEEVKDDKEGN